MIRITILVLLATIIIMLIHLNCNYSSIDSINERLNKLEMEIEKLRLDLQIKGILPYDEEKGYWKSYDGSEDLCMEGIQKCL